MSEVESDKVENSAQQAYRTEIKLLGGKRHQGILQHLSEGNATLVLSLKNTYVGDIGIVSLCNIMPIHTPLITVLDLRSNGLSNASCPSLCDACRQLPNLKVLNVSNNRLITRQGGANLLSLASSHSGLLWVGCDEATISRYFYSRICSLGEMHMAELKQTSGEKHSFWKSYIDNIVQGKLPGTVLQPAPPPSSCLKPNSGTRKWNRAHRPLSTLPDQRGSKDSSLDGDDIYEEDGLLWTESGKKKSNPHLPSSLLGSISNDITDLFQLIDLYKPKTIEIPTPFKFPGKISYIPVAGCPDCMLSPDAPGILPPVSKIKVDSKSMYWSFICSAHPEVLKKSTLDVPLNPNSNPEKTLAKLQADIYHANIAPPVGFVLPPLIGADDDSQSAVDSTTESSEPIIKSHQDGLQVISDKRCLASLYRPSVLVNKNNPSDESIPDRDVEQYFQKHILNKNSVLLSASSDPLSNPELLDGYKLHRIIKPTFDGPTTKPSRLTSGALSADGSILATGSYDRTAKMWDASTGELLSVLDGHDGYVYDVIWNAPHFDRLITASFDKTCKVWDASTWKCLHTLGNHDLEVVCVCVNRDSTLIASGSMDQTVIVWNALTGSQVAAMNGHSAEIVCIDFSPFNSHLVSGSADESIRLWNALTGECLSVFEGHTGEVSALKFNVHGNLILSCSSDTTCRLWDVNTKKCKTLKGHSKDVSDCEFSSDGWLVASASEDMSARVWDSLSAGCISMVKGHQAGICCVSFGRNSTELLTGSADMTCRRWKVSTGECLQVLFGHKSVVISSYCVDEYSILTISKDNSCRIWRREDTHSLLEFLLHYAATNPKIKKKLLSDKRIPSHLVNELYTIEERLGISVSLSSVNALHYPQSPLE